MTERLTSSSVPVRASGEPQKLEKQDYALIAEAVEDFLGFDITTREQQDRITRWASASPSDDGARQPPTCDVPVYCAHCEHEIVNCPECGKQEWRIGFAASDDGAARPPQEPSVPVQPETGAEPMEWRCFHCDEVFTTIGEARDHFGGTEFAEPGCLIDRVAIEEGGKPERGRGLLMALRRLEAEIEKLRRENEQLDHEAGHGRAMEMEIGRYWKGARSVRDAFNEYDSMEGRALAAEEQLKALRSASLREPPEGWEPAMGPHGPTTEWRDGQERDIVKPMDWEGDLPTEHLNRCKLRDNLLYADILNGDGSHRATWRCHKREGHDGPCSSHNDCGVMNGGVVCGKLPGHDGPHAWQQFISSPAAPLRETAPARKSILVDRDAELLAELRVHLDGLVITSENIGDVRRKLFMPWCGLWNGWVRDETASRENKPPLSAIASSPAPPETQP